MLQIYDDQHRRIAGINDPDDLKIEKTLSSGDKQISFSYPKTGSEIENLRAEYYIRTKDDEYVLKEISTGENKNSYVAQLNIEELESQEFLYGFESVTQTARACLEFAFDGTGWLMLVVILVLFLIDSSRKVMTLSLLNLPGTHLIKP